MEGRAGGTKKGRGGVGHSEDHGKPSLPATPSTITVANRYVSALASAVLFAPVFGVSPALAERVIRYWSFEDDVVLDPFGGVGTVGVAAARLGRRFVLSEIEPRYVEVMRRELAPWLTSPPPPRRDAHHDEAEPRC